jgi:carbon storage regulator
MLVLSRKTGEAIQIGTEIEVKVVSVRNNRVRLAFEGPRHIRIMRAELLQRENSPPAPAEQASAARR